MGLFDVERIRRVVMLDEKVYKEIRDDEEATVQALVVLLLASIIGGIWSIITAPWIGLIFIVIGVPIILFIGTAILHVIAKLLGGKAGFMGYLRVLCYTQAPNALGIIPLIGSIIGSLWVLVCEVIATKSAHELSLGRAITVVLLPVIVLVLIIFAVVLWQLGIAS